MSRHNRRVPTSFFYRFTLDACAFADKWAQGRIVSVLEGGYSDKALLSGAMAHLTGLVDGGERASGNDTDHSRESWWSPENVQMVKEFFFARGDCLLTQRTAREVGQEMSGTTVFARRGRYETPTVVRSHVDSACPARPAQLGTAIGPQHLHPAPT
jgi:hypothetical protein